MPESRELTPEYWNGHTLDDGCRPSRYKLRGHLSLARFEERDTAAKILQTLLDSGGGTVVRKFQPGSVFDGEKDFPYGTVIRYRQESLGFMQYPSTFQADDFWGVTVPSSRKNEGILLISWLSSAVEDRIYRTRLQFHQKFPRVPIIPVGTVEHIDDALIRTPSLEVRKIGHGVRKPERQTSRLRRLIPGFNT
jgi:hypothetical protein